MDLILVGYLVATVLLVLTFAGRIPSAAGVAAGHLFAAVAYVVVKRLARARRAWRLPYLLAPFLLVLAVFQGLGFIIPHLRAETADAALAAWDLRVFGVEPTRALGDRLTPWTATALQLCYTSYYFVFVALACVLVWRRIYATMLRYSAVVAGCFFTTYIGYYLVPAYGPRTHFRYEEPLPLEGLAGGIHRLLDRLEYIKLDAFPSGHTALSLVCLALLFRLRARVAWILAPLIFGLIVSTVALRYHYAVDVFAGILCAMLWFPWGLRLVRRRDAAD